MPSIGLPRTSLVIGGPTSRMTLTISAATVGSSGGLLEYIFWTVLPSSSNFRATLSIVSYCSGLPHFLGFRLGVEDLVGVPFGEAPNGVPAGGVVRRLRQEDAEDQTRERGQGQREEGAEEHVSFEEHEGSPLRVGRLRVDPFCDGVRRVRLHALVDDEFREKRGDRQLSVDQEHGPRPRLLQSESH